MTAILLVPFLSAAATIDRQSAMEQRAEGSFANTVEKAKRHDRSLGAAELFQAAFYFCETGRHLDQLDIFFDVAAEMQDCDPASRTYGNFRWTWRDGFVMDPNAVDFCMQTGSLLARDHLDKMSAAQREKFLAVLDRAIAGCLAHRVRDSYTNIAIMNSANLILLGEARSRRDVFAEGVTRANSRSGTILDPTVWPTGGTKGHWQWRAFKAELTLPAGPVVLTLHSREDGTKIDRLFLASDPSQEPEE